MVDSKTKKKKRDYLQLTITANIEGSPEKPSAYNACLDSHTQRCNEAKLLLTEDMDPLLARATENINTILAEVEKEGGDSHRRLAILNTTDKDGEEILALDWISRDIQIHRNEGDS